MSRDNLVSMISGVFFGVLVGWMIGTQVAKPTPAQSAAATVPAAAPADMTQAQAQTPPTTAPLNEARATELKKIAENDPSNVAARRELGNMYFDADQFENAIPYYEQALKLQPANADVSTDLGVAYLYTRQTDRAIAQFEKSIAVDPKHVKTWLNIGLAKAMVKGDAAGGEAAFQKVVELAPGTEEAKTAQRGIDAIRAGHKGQGGH